MPKCLVIRLYLTGNVPVFNSTRCKQFRDSHSVIFEGTPSNALGRRALQLDCSRASMAPSNYDLHQGSKRTQIHWFPRGDRQDQCTHSLKHRGLCSRSTSIREWKVESRWTDIVVRPLLQLEIQSQISPRCSIHHRVRLARRENVPIRQCERSRSAASSLAWQRPRARNSPDPESCVVNGCSLLCRARSCWQG